MYTSAKRKKATKQQKKKRGAEKLKLKNWVKYLIAFLYLANIIFIVKGLDDNLIAIETAKNYFIILLLITICLLIQKIHNK